MKTRDLRLVAITSQLLLFTVLLACGCRALAAAQKLPEAPQGPSVAAQISQPAPSNQYVGDN